MSGTTISSPAGGARRGRLPACALALAALTLIAMRAPHAGAAEWGLSEQHASAFGDARFAALPMDHVRLVAPWDAAWSDPAMVDAWLARALGRGLTPLVAFERSPGDRCPAQPCRVPAVAAYRDAIAAFRARWPAVREFSSWNEPNHPSQPTASAPAATAALHDALVRDCPACTVTAGDMVDSASMRGWMRLYRAALTTAPEVWSLHNYGDTTYDRPSYTEWLLDQVDTPVWITETGGIARLTSGGVDLLPADEARAAASMRKAIRLVEAHPQRIERAYAYQWAERPWEPFDSALVRADASERPSLTALRGAIGTRPPRAAAPEPPAGPLGGAAGAGGVPGSGTTVAGTTSAARAHRRPVRVHGGYRLGVRCAARRRSCRGRVTFSAAPATGGRRLVLGSQAFRIRGGAWRSVVVPVSRPRLRRARALPQWRLVATILVRRPATLTERSWEGAA